MEQLLQSVKIGINEKIYVKDPESSNLGKRIVEQSILMINEMGFESFTFKKLGTKIGSNESSIYRYFENKHKLLLYLTSWYWGWIEYQLVFSTNSIADPQLKLEKAIEVPMIFHDERLSSFDAEEKLAMLELTNKRRKKRLDAVAAANILQAFLEHTHGRTEANPGAEEQ